MAHAAAAAVDTRTLILDAARSRLLADGYAGLSTRKVAEEAGVPVSQLNYHFGSKQGLILALFEEENQRRLAPPDPHVRRGRAVVAALRAGLRLPRGRPGLRLRAGAAGDDRRRLVERRAWRGSPRAARRLVALLAEVAREAERRHGPLGPFTAEELATLVASAFFGSESLLLLGFDREVLPIRSALRRVGVLIRQLEEGPAAPRRTEDAGMPAVS